MERPQAFLVWGQAFPMTLVPLKTSKRFCQSDFRKTSKTFKICSHGFYQRSNHFTNRSFEKTMKRKTRVCKIWVLFRSVKLIPAPWNSEFGHNRPTLKVMCNPRILNSGFLHLGALFSFPFWTIWRYPKLGFFHFWLSASYEEPFPFYFYAKKVKD